MYEIIPTADNMTGLHPALQSGEATSDELQDESFLTEQINRLWLSHQAYDGAMRTQKSTMRSVDAELGRLLFNMKHVLAKPGRSGGWSEFLRERKIPRASADRLVQRFAATLPAEHKLPHESVSDPTEAEIQSLFTSVWRRASKVLTTDTAAYQFLIHILVASGIGYEWQDNGVLVLQPVSPAAVATPEPATPSAAAVSAGALELNGDLTTEAVGVVAGEHSDNAL